MEQSIFLLRKCLKSSQSAVEEVVRHLGLVEEAQVDYKTPHLLLQQVPMPLRLVKGGAEESFHRRQSHNLEEIQPLDPLLLRMEVDMEVYMLIHLQEDAVEVVVVQQEHKDTQEVLIVVVEAV
jgi:hypothetical protein